MEIVRMEHTGPDSLVRHVTHDNKQTVCGRHYNWFVPAPDTSMIIQRKHFLPNNDPSRPSDFVQVFTDCERCFSSIG